MENNVNGTEVAPTTAAGQHKSNAAWITGLIGFCLAIPNLICIWACTIAASVATAVGEGLGAEKSGSTENVYTAGIAYLIVFALLCAVDFGLCFMGKGDKSKITGIIMIAVAAVLIILSLIVTGIGGSILAFAIGGLYIASGIVSIKNQDLPA